MAVRFLAALALGATLATTAQAETIIVDGGVAVRASSVERPSRGMTMTNVEARFGAPVERHATIGQPPITRWDYAGFSVFFEGNLVLHSVAIG